MTQLSYQMANFNWFFRGNQTYKSYFFLQGSCNHTIMTRGTFSIFASVLAHGETYTIDNGPTLPKRLMQTE